MGRFTVRIPDDVETKARSAAKEKGVSLSAYVKDALTGDPSARQELNRATMEAELEKFRGEQVTMMNTVISLMKSVSYLSKFQRRFLFRLAEYVQDDEEAAAAIMEKVDKDMIDMEKREAKKT